MTLPERIISITVSCGAETVNATRDVNMKRQKKFVVPSWKHVQQSCRLLWIFFKLNSLCVNSPVSTPRVSALTSSLTGSPPGVPGVLHHLSVAIVTVARQRSISELQQLLSTCWRRDWQEIHVKSLLSVKMLKELFSRAHEEVKLQNQNHWSKSRVSECLICVFLCDLTESQLV